MNRALSYDPSTDPHFHECEHADPIDQTFADPLAKDEPDTLVFESLVEVDAETVKQLWRDFIISGDGDPLRQAVRESKWLAKRVGVAA